MTDQPSPLTVRPAEAADVPVLLEMMRELAAYQNEADKIGATPESLRRDGFGATPLFHALIAEIDGIPTGYLTYTLSYTIWGGGHYLNVDDVYVRAAWRGRGIGRALMAPIRRLVTEMGSYARWSVHPDNHRAIAFYRSLGAHYVAKGLCYLTPDGAAIVGQRPPPA